MLQRTSPNKSEIPIDQGVFLFDCYDALARSMCILFIIANPLKTFKSCSIQIKRFSFKKNLHLLEKTCHYLAHLWIIIYINSAQPAVYQNLENMRLSNRFFLQIQET